MIRPAVVLVAAACGLAHAAPLPALTFETVENSSVPSLSGFTTYDVYFTNLASMTLTGVAGFDFASTAGPAQLGIPVSGAVFNEASVGGNAAPDPALFPAFPAVEFDTYWTIGGQAISFTPGTVDLAGADGLLNGEFTLASGAIDIATADRVRVARVTINGAIDVDRLIGFRVILATGERIPFIVPGPGAACVLSLGLLGVARRRR